MQCGAAEVQLRHMAFVFNFYLFRSRLRQLSSKATQMFSQFHIWLELWGILCADRGHIQGVTHSTIQQVIRKLFSHLNRNIFLSLGG